MHSLYHAHDINVCIYMHLYRLFMHDGEVVNGQQTETQVDMITQLAYCHSVVFVLHVEKPIVTTSPALTKQ